MKQSLNISKRKKLAIHLLIGRGRPVVIAEILIIALLIASSVVLGPQLSASTYTPVDTVPPTSKLSFESTVASVIAEEDVRVSSELGFSKAIYADAERSFYLTQAESHRIVDAVYMYAGELNKDFIFALVEHESRFDPIAVNENIDKETRIIISIDRGLFQLNSKSYPKLSEEDFFRVETNVRYGIAHIRGEIAYNKGNLRLALYTYNAGRNGIRDGVPTRTLQYAADILARTEEIKNEREQFIRDRLQEYAVYSTHTGGTRLAGLPTKGVVE